MGVKVRILFFDLQVEKLINGMLLSHRKNLISMVSIQ